MPKGGSGAGVEPRLAQNVQDRALWSRRARRVPEKSHSAQRLHGTSTFTKVRLGRRPGREEQRLRSRPHDIWSGRRARQTGTLNSEHTRS